jgi:UDP-N-acetylglucosamine enolpyruvyl transferase
MSTNVGFDEGGILVGMATEGTAHIAGVSHVGWGYKKLDLQLHLLGASIQRLPSLPFDPTMWYFHPEREL